MTAPLDALVASIRDRYDECFACGLGNPIGLQLDGFRIEGEEVVVPFRPRSEYRGFEGVLHGGVVATALDEVLAWAAMLLEGHLVLTGTLDIRYRKMARADADFELRGRVDERRGKRMRLSGVMTDGGDVVASASGLYLSKEEIA